MDVYDIFAEQTTSCTNATKKAELHTKSLLSTITILQENIWKVFLQKLSWKLHNIIALHMQKIQLVIKIELELVFEGKERNFLRKI